MKINIFDGLPFVEAVATCHGKNVNFRYALLDSGSAKTVLSANVALEIGIKLEAKDDIKRLRGVGGVELVFVKRIEALKVGNFVFHSPVVQFGALDYGFDIDAILGFDAMSAAGMLLDFKKLRIRGP